MENARATQTDAAQVEALERITSGANEKDGGKKRRFKAASGSAVEGRFIDLFAETFGLEKTEFLYSQYPFFDIYQNARFADFALEERGRRVAIEIDDDATHHPRAVSFDKHVDDLLKQNSMIGLGWSVFRWTARQILQSPDAVKDELRVFIGSDPRLRAIDDFLPTQRGKALDGKGLSLYEHQREALEALREARENRETIALLYHATGSGKTTTAVCDAKSVGGRVLFVAHTRELVEQARTTFEALWPEATTGKFADGEKTTDAQVVCGSVQSVALNLELFREDEFDYLIVDEAHHATAETYRKIIAYFKPKFTLGLTATPERADDENILEIFQKTAHKLDMQTAIEVGALAPVRSFRVKTNIDISNVRFNGVRYNVRELDDKICVVERNRLIVDVWVENIRDKRTVVFCASVKCAEELAALFRERGVAAVAVSGNLKTSARNERLTKFATGEILVLCACDLLNEGWDCPETEVLFMARPTMSKLLYLQQLGRGMRTAPNKDCLFVFDFVDSAGRFNAPFTLHRVAKLREYRPGEIVWGRKGQREIDLAIYARGEKPVAVVDFPLFADDIEPIELFDWQEEAAGMISLTEFARRVDVQLGTVEERLRDGRLLPDLVVPVSENRVFKFFKEETLRAAAERFGWTLIDDSNRKDVFMKFVERMDMAYSYKPVLLKAILKNADENGRVAISALVDYFREFYANRRKQGLVVEKGNSLYQREDCSDKEIERNILANPFRRFEEMSAARHSKSLGTIEVERTIWRKLTDDDKRRIETICDQKLDAYFRRLEENKAQNG
ncbi:MAG: DEAD/DEAH box helicase family protein [Thermoguttaceae bacterium]|nr:DEAD/DEAH box helicase family protein [Thermoguttaceae bacterium]